LNVRFIIMHGTCYDDIEITSALPVFPAGFRVPPGFSGEEPAGARQAFVPLAPLGDVMAIWVEVRLATARDFSATGACGAALAECARRFGSDIRLTADGHEIDAKAPAAARLRAGSLVQLLVDGQDEEAAVRDLLSLLQAN
jgi:phosphocarrier protein HPr